MAQYALYGKRPQDKTFKPLNYAGERVNKKDLKDTFATRQDAQDFLDSKILKPNVEVEIRAL